MPIKVSNCGRIWLIDNNGVYFRELTIAEARLHLETMQGEIIQEGETRKYVDEFTFRQRRLETEAKENGIEEQRAEAKRKMKHAEKKLQQLKDRAEEFHSRERESHERLEDLEKAILKQQGLDRARIEEERFELELLKNEHNEMLEVLKLEKDCLDRDRAELADKERQIQGQSEQRRLVQARVESDVQKREEKIRQQQEVMEWERLDFELVMNKQGDEARKKNAEIPERDRITQMTEAQERADLRIAEAKRAQEDANRRQQALWVMEMEKLRVRAERLSEDEAKVAANTENMAAAEKHLKEVKASLTKITEEFAAFRKEARNKIDSLMAEHEAKDGAIQTDLKNALEVARNKSQELQGLHAQLVEEDLKRARDRRSADPGRLHEKVSEAPAGHAESDHKKFNEKEIKGGDSRSTDSIAAKIAESTQVDKNEAVGQTANTTNSPTIDDFVFIGSDSSFQPRDHALMRHSDNEDYLEDSDFDHTN
ncbi:hypothetical protein DL98DRAFT_582095 [Cadophora sp. DSE1049]|nr:hypothetical protein DL98DRAFT_582095 [Cadophora sp. DSE1049]